MCLQLFLGKHNEEVYWFECIRLSWRHDGLPQLNRNIWIMHQTRPTTLCVNARMLVLSKLAHQNAIFLSCRLYDNVVTK